MLQKFPGQFKIEKMNFEEKIALFFEKKPIKLSHPPAAHLVHIYADYIEVVSIFSNQNYVSSTDILDRFCDEGIILKSEAVADEDRAAVNDKNERWINEIFLVLLDRMYLYGEEYPFVFLGNNKIKLKPQHEITSKHKIYVFLLLASSLALFNDFRSEITTEFELVSYNSLVNYMPLHATVKSFGKNSEYEGTAKEKIRKLGAELNVSVNEEFIAMISDQGNQERGLDLVGWIPFTDKVANHFALFCQCACGKEWYKKLTETSRYENYFKFHCNKPNHAMFVPYSLINYGNSTLYQGDEIPQSLMFERKRILQFNLNLDYFNALNSKRLVDRCLEFEEDIV